jgi:hypothetical protein
MAQCGLWLTVDCRFVVIESLVRVGRTSEAESASRGDRRLAALRRGVDPSSRSGTRHSRPHVQPVAADPPSATLPRRRRGRGEFACAGVRVASHGRQPEPESNLTTGLLGQILILLMFAYLG